MLYRSMPNTVSKFPHTIAVTEFHFVTIVNNLLSFIVKSLYRITRVCDTMDWIAKTITTATT